MFKPLQICIFSATFTTVNSFFLRSSETQNAQPLQYNPVAIFIASIGTAYLTSPESIREAVSASEMERRNGARIRPKLASEPSHGGDNFAIVDLLNVVEGFDKLRRHGVTARKE